MRVFEQVLGWRVQASTSKGWEERARARGLEGVWSQGSSEIARASHVCSLFGKDPPLPPAEAVSRCPDPLSSMTEW